MGYARFTHAIINTGNNTCVDLIVWNGVAIWSPPENCIAVPKNGIHIGDICVEIDGVWSKQ